MFIHSAEHLLDPFVLILYEIGADSSIFKILSFNLQFRVIFICSKLVKVSFYKTVCTLKHIARSLEAILS